MSNTLLSIDTAVPVPPVDSLASLDTPISDVVPATPPHDSPLLPLRPDLRLSLVHAHHIQPFSPYASSPESEYIRARDMFTPSPSTSDRPSPPCPALGPPDRESSFPPPVSKTLRAARSASASEIPSPVSAPCPSVPVPMSNPARLDARIMAHPYARLTKKDGGKRRKMWNHALEKALFTAQEM